MTSCCRSFPNRSIASRQIDDLNDLVYAAEIVGHLTISVFSRPKCHKTNRVSDVAVSSSTETRIPSCEECLSRPTTEGVPSLTRFTSRAPSKQSRSSSTSPAPTLKNSFHFKSIDFTFETSKCCRRQPSCTLRELRIPVTQVEQ